MLILSSACTFQSVVAALVGGGLIGALAGTRLLGQHKTLPSATFVPSVTFGVIGGGYLLQQLFLCTGNTVAAAHPGITLFEPPGSSLSYGRIVLAAACVGAGAKLGQGCTCGNGIQGLSGFSRTSFQFVCIFMVTAMVVASLFETAHTLDVVDDINDNHPTEPQYTSTAYLMMQIGIAVVGIIAQLDRTSVVPTVVIDVLAGIAFATALSVSGMIKPSKVVDFLDVFGTRGWDPSLLGVMGGGIAVCMSLYQFAGGIRTPAIPASAASSAAAPPLAMLHPWITRPMDLEHLLGALLFGTGWGLAGLCPGPVLVNCGLQSYKAIVFALVMFVIRPIIGALQVAMGRTKTRTSTATRPAGPTTTTTSHKKD